MRSGLRLTFVACTLGLVLMVSAKASGGNQKIILGRITDESNANIPGAVVDLECRQDGKKNEVAGRKSGADGRFQIRGRLRGVCKISITMAGFSDVTIPVSNSDKHSTIDLGTIQLRLNCKGPGVNCDEFTPAKSEDSKDH